MKKYNRKFGCEFEISTGFYKVKKIIEPIILNVYGRNKFKSLHRVHNSENNRQWHLKLDSSTGCECVTPISNYKDLGKICKVISLLSKNDKIEITEHDAMHVHIDAKDMSDSHLVVAWMQIEKIFIRCFPEHRRFSNYCEQLLAYQRKNKKLSDCFIDALRISEDHHSIFSLDYFKRRKTVEFRICEGTLDPYIVKNLIRFYMLFLNYAKTIDPAKIICSYDAIESITELISIIDINNLEIEDFLHDRYKKFS